MEGNGKFRPVPPASLSGKQQGVVVATITQFQGREAKLDFAAGMGNACLVCFVSTNPTEAFCNKYYNTRNLLNVQGGTQPSSIYR